MDYEFFKAQIENRFNKEYTAEQDEFIRDITTPTLVFADPGVGKTESVVAGLLAAEMVHRINPKNISALSFTNQATVELTNRHENACKKLGIGSYVNFQTLDSMCTDIIRQNFGYLSMEGWEVDEITITEPMKIEDMAEYIIDVASAEEISVNPNNVKNIVMAMRSLNSALIFDRAHVESKLAFKRTGLSYEEFQTIRKSVYVNNKILKKVRVDDIALYTLEILTKAPEIATKLRAKNRIIVVDEFQDMSLIKLELLSRLTDCLVVVGDIKQQIYAFNGACSEIVEMYRKYYPQRREVSLSKSFRCASAIAEFAKGIIAPNDMGGEKFQGIDKEGKVNFYSAYDLDALCKSIKEGLEENRHVFKKQIMFLYRNNHSAVPVVEKLYKYRVPVLVSKHIEAHKMPVIGDLCSLTEIIRNPNSPHVIEILNKLVPEFTKFRYKPALNPIIQIMRKEGLGFFDVDYRFKDSQCQDLLYSCLKDAKRSLDSGAMVREVFNELFPYYSTYFLREKEKYMEQPAKYYINLVASMTQTKTYLQFINDELRKMEFVEECAKNRFGIRCLTFHASKGTEADIVHILDANEGIIPNIKKLEETLRYGCIIDAARDVRNERSLAFVASTRAREELNIHHSGELASMFSSKNNFEHLDLAYKSYNPFHNDVSVFAEFFV